MYPVINTIIGRTINTETPKQFSTAPSGDSLRWITIPQHLHRHEEGVVDKLYGYIWRYAPTLSLTDAHRVSSLNRIGSSTASLFLQGVELMMPTLEDLEGYREHFSVFSTHHGLYTCLTLLGWTGSAKLHSMYLAQWRLPGEFRRSQMCSLRLTSFRFTTISWHLFNLS